MAKDATLLRCSTKLCGQAKEYEKPQNPDILLPVPLTIGLIGRFADKKRNRLSFCSFFFFFSGIIA